MDEPGILLRALGLAALGLAALAYNSMTRSLLIPALCGSLYV